MAKTSARPKTKGHHPDYVIILCLALLIAFGLVMLSSASSNLGKARFGDTYYYLKHQLLYGFIFGFIGFLITSRFYYRRYQKLALWLLIGSIILLGLVFSPLGVTVKGSSRWLALGPLTFQPAEIVKITFIIYLSAWLSSRSEKQKHSLSGFLPFLVILGTVALLLLNQPATSITAILILVGLVIYFLSGARLRYLLFTIPVVALIFLLFIYATPYRLERIINFLDPQTDSLSGGFHLNQTQIAIGSGGLFGVGYGKSTTKLNYLPEPVGDSIFAVIAEELGFVGALILLMVFFTLIFKIFLNARKHRDKFAGLMLSGFGVLIALQVFTHIGAVSGVIPFTGTPLPFISFGGTALFVFMTMGGIITNISKYS